MSHQTGHSNMGVSLLCRYHTWADGRRNDVRRNTAPCIVMNIYRAYMVFLKGLDPTGCGQRASMGSSLRWARLVSTAAAAGAAALEAPPQLSRDVCLAAVRVEGQRGQDEQSELQRQRSPHETVAVAAAVALLPSRYASKRGSGSERGGVSARNNSSWPPVSRPKGRDHLKVDGGDGTVDAKLAQHEAPQRVEDPCQHQQQRPAYRVHTVVQAVGYTEGDGVAQPGQKSNQPDHQHRQPRAILVHWHDTAHALRSQPKTQHQSTNHEGDSSGHEIARSCNGLHIRELPDIYKERQIKSASEREK